jgi:hypothetical protein
MLKILAEEIIYKYQKYYAKTLQDAKTSSSEKNA